MLDWLFGDAEQGRGSAEENPSMRAQLCLVSVSHGFLALHNAGGAPARRIRLDTERSSIGVINRVDEPIDLDPGESWTFLIEDLGPWTDEGWHIFVSWEDQPEPVCIPLPAGAL
jgi:hypothetical protein